MAISIGDALLKLGVDDKDLQKGMKGIGASIKKHQKAISLGMVAAGGAILATGVLAVKTFAKMGDEVQKMAFRTGFSTQSLSELRHVAEITGTSLSGVEKGVKKMSKTISDANDGLATYVRAFDKIGLSAEELMKLSPEEQFEKITMAIADLENETVKAAVAQEIFGRQGTQLLPMLAEGADGIKRLREEAHELGIVFDQEAADKAAEFQDAMTRMEGSVNGVKFALAEKLIPTLTDLIDKVTDIVKGFTDWAKKNPGLSNTLIKVGGALGGLLVVAGGLGLILPTLIRGFGFLKTAMFKLIPTIWAVVVALWAKVTALFAVLAASGPAGWVALAAGMVLIATTAVMVTLKLREEKKALDDVTESEYNLAAASKEVGVSQDMMANSSQVATDALNTETMAIDDQTKAVKNLISTTWELSKARAGLGGFTWKEWEKIMHTQPGYGTAYRGTGQVTSSAPGYSAANITVEVDGEAIVAAIGAPLVDDLRLRTGSQK